MKQIRNLSLLVFVLLAAGCAFNPQTANLQPNVSVESSDIGANSTVFVNVLDERGSKSLGRRGTAYGAAAEITSAEELSVVVSREIKKGLEQKGFTVVDRESAQSTLTVEIRTLEYSTSQGFWTGGVHISGAFKGRAKNMSSEMEKMYRYSKEERVVVVPTAQTNEKWINQALSETLKELINDHELLHFLSKSPVADKITALNQSTSAQ
jgi:uncharacterized lipoprotein YajG